MSEIPVMLKPKEAAAKFCLPEHFIRKLLWEKKIHFVKAGNRYLINEKSLCDYLNQGEV